MSEQVKFSMPPGLRDVIDYACREWQHFVEVDTAPMNCSRYVLREIDEQIASGIITSPDRVDVEKVRAVIAEMRDYVSNRDNQSTSSIESWADEIEAALGGKENSDE